MFLILVSNLQKYYWHLNGNREVISPLVETAFRSIINGFTFIILFKAFYLYFCTKIFICGKYIPTYLDNIGKPKELWKTINSLGLNSKQSNSKICLKKNGTLSFDTNFFSKLAENLLNNLPISTNKFGLNCVKVYYEKQHLLGKKIHLHTLQKKLFQEF